MTCLYEKFRSAVATFTPLNYLSSGMTPVFLLCCAINVCLGHRSGREAEGSKSRNKVFAGKLVNNDNIGLSSRTLCASFDTLKIIEF